MFNDFPKKRIELPEEFQKIYSEHYKINRDGQTTATSLSKKMETWMHKKVAEDVKDIFNKSTLEIGAGTLNQLYYEKTRPYDMVEPFIEFYFNSEFKNKIDKNYTDIDEISKSDKYDRITSIATFEHLTDLPKIVAKTCILLNNDGVLRVAIPNEGTFLWKLGWKLTTGIGFKLKYGLNYEILMKYEHVNTAQDIEYVLKYFYGKINCSCYGINRRIAFYRFYECSLPKIEIAQEYLKMQ